MQRIPMEVYVGVHRPPTSAAPSPVTTYVSPWRISEATVLGKMASHNPAPVLQLRHRRLIYPPVPIEPTVGLEMTRQQYASCDRCHLCESRNSVVFHRGNPFSPVVCVGEGPGKKEDYDGNPFVGPSGCLQSELFRECGIDPEAHIGWMNLVG